MILFSDLNFFMFTKYGFLNNSYVWNQNEFGHYSYNNIVIYPFVAVFKVISNLSNIYFASNVYFFGIYLGMIFSSVYLAKSLNKNRDFIDYFIISIFAIANPLFFSLFGQIDIAYSLVFVNFFMGYLLKNRDKLKLKDILVLISLILLANIYIQTTLLLVAILALYFFVYRWRLTLQNKKPLITFVLIFCLLNSFWIIFLANQFVNGQLDTSIESYNPSSSQGIGIVNYMSATIRPISPFILSHYYEENYKAILYFYSRVFTMYILLGIFVFILYQSFLNKKNKTKLDLLIIFLFFVYLIFYVFSLGDKVYFRSIFMFFWNHVPFFNLYRSIHKFLFPLFLVSLILFLYSLDKIKGKKVAKVLILICIAPLLVIFFDKNFKKSINSYKIPDYYFELSKKASENKDDSIIKIIPETNWYVKFDWNPNGNDSGNVAPLFLNGKRTSYNYARYSLDTPQAKINDEISRSLLSCDKNKNVEKLLGLLNIREVLLQKDAIVLDQRKRCLANMDKSGLVKHDDLGNLELYRLRQDYFLPHFYIPQNIIISKRNTDEIQRILSQDDYQIRSAIFFNNQNIGKEELLSELKNSSNNPEVEFKKVNPTKYRVIIHKAKYSFPLIFAEKFNKDWKLYINKNQDKKSKVTSLDSYNILEENEENQANKDELMSYIKSGWITSLGSGNKIDFISKNFQGTIQNDNLPSGNIFETWFKKPIIDDKNHLMANGYANSWIIDPADLCKNNNSCVKNADGTYDFELVVEFWPQRLFYVGIFISGATLLACLVFLIYNYRKREMIC